MTRSTGPSTAGDLMAVDPIVIGANMPLDEAADLLHRLVVVADDDRTLPIGVLSTTDVVHATAEHARAAAARTAGQPDVGTVPAND